MREALEIHRDQLAELLDGALEPEEERALVSSACASSAIGSTLEPPSLTASDETPEAGGPDDGNETASEPRAPSRSVTGSYRITACRRSSGLADLDRAPLFDQAPAREPAAPRGRRERRGGRRRGAGPLYRPGPPASGRSPTRRRASSCRTSPACRASSTSPRCATPSRPSAGAPSRSTPSSRSTS